MRLLHYFCLLFPGPKRARLDVVQSGSQRAPARTSNLQAPIMMLSGHDGEIYAARFSNDGTFLASAGFDMGICEFFFYGYICSAFRL